MKKLNDYNVLLAHIIQCQLQYDDYSSDNLSVLFKKINHIANVPQKNINIIRCLQQIADIEWLKSRF